MNGRRIYHARGKVLGGSSSINGMIFQRGNPLDYERWAADPGHGRRGTTRTACRTSSAWRLPRGGARRRSAGTAARCVLERGPATNPLFGAFFEAVQQAGYELTDDVNGYRQEGFAPFDRNIRRGRRLSAARRVPAPGDAAAEPRGADARVRHAGSCSTGTRAVGVEYTTRPGRAPRSGARRARSSCAAARSTRRSCCSSRASATPTSCAALGIAVVHDLPGVGEHLQDHLEVYIQHACTQPVSMQPVSLKWRHRPWIGLQWLFLRRGPGRDEPLRGRRLRAQQRRRRLPEPDVPLPADRDPLRRLGRRRAATATRCTSGRCTPTRAAR